MRERSKNTTCKNEKEENSLHNPDVFHKNGCKYILVPVKYNTGVKITTIGLQKSNQLSTNVENNPSIFVCQQGFCNYLPDFMGLSCPDMNVDMYLLHGSTEKNHSCAQLYLSNPFIMYLFYPAFLK